MITRRLALLTALLPLACTDPPGSNDSGDSQTPTTTLGPTIDSATSVGATMGTMDSGSTSSPTSGADSTSTSGFDTDQPLFDVGGTIDMGNGGCGAPAPTNATLTGTVYAPNGEIPISNALVYTTAVPPAGIPQQVYCDECQAVNCDDFFTLTNVDGTFSLDTQAGDGQYLVVQKGQFLRDVVIDVAEGETDVPVDQTNLPGEWNPDAGMWIPRIAVYQTDPDQVYNVLAKFGLGEVSAGGTLVPGTQRFTLVPDDDQGAFMDDLVDMSQYHIIFLPCATTVFWTQAPYVSPQRIQNIRDYVAAGGRWYATDHSNEYIKEPFPAYLDLHNPAMPDIQPAYTVAGTVVDPGLLAWLEALPPDLANIGGGNPTLDMLPMVDLMHNYSGIDAVHSVIVQDDQGADVDVGPHTWVSGPCTSCSDPVVQRPMAITGQYGCGRMMYSTFENSSSPHQGLNPQELVLLYMILEIGVCHDKPPPPIPPVG
ncbi:MAG: hypothetical protein KDK70_12900 [Myxococcales bacterium]|nr:hypothetical protein [Myxococcales bacterium]